MSIPKSQKQDEEQKKHGDTMGRAFEGSDKHKSVGNRDIDPVPAPENGSHSHSHAAHLGEHVQEHTKTAGNLRNGPASDELREPPMEVDRLGKKHRKQ
jgi:hypothetical protein